MHSTSNGKIRVDYKMFLTLHLFTVTRVTKFHKPQHLNAGRLTEMPLKWGFPSFTAKYID